MKEFILIVFAAGLIYYIATRVAPKNLIFKLSKDEPKKQEKVPEEKTDDPTDTRKSHLSKGQELFNKGDLEGAEKAFIAAIKEDHASATAYSFLGMIYLRQKMYKGAIETLIQAVKLDPLNDIAYNNLGLAYYNTEDFAKAVENLEKSISLNDKIGHRFQNLALAYQKVENLDKAAIALENSVKIHPNVENLTMLAKNYQKMGNKKLFKNTLVKVLDIEPTNSWAKRQMSALDD